MGVAMFCATAFVTSPSVHRALAGKQNWTAMTVCLVLEKNVGATWRKGSLRALGAVAGGVGGAVAVLITSVLCGGWPPGAPTRKILAMSFSVAGLVAAVHARCARDPNKRDYAYTVCKLTIVVCSLSSFTDSDGALVLTNVVLRVATIMLGGVLALACSLVVLPEYASEAQSSVLAKACLETQALYAGLVRAHAAPPHAGRRPKPLPELHARELKLAALLERYSALLGQAGEERRLRLGRHLVRPEEAAAAGAAARALFTGAVALLHACESCPRTHALMSMHAAHAAELEAATAALCGSLACAAQLIGANSAEEGGTAEAASVEAMISVRRLDDALCVLAAVLARSGDAAAGQPEQRDAHRDLSALAWALQDAAESVCRIVANSLPQQRTGLEEEWSAQRALAAVRRSAAVRLHILAQAAVRELEALGGASASTAGRPV
jgi:hypothetical protein